MTTPILLPPLPDFEGDTSPDIRDFNTKRITRAELRARDLEVARVVLEAAKRACAEQNTVITTVTGATHWGTPTDCINAIDKIEVKHHE